MRPLSTSSNARGVQHNRMRMDAAILEVRSRAAAHELAQQRCRQR